MTGTRDASMPVRKKAAGELQRKGRGMESGVRDAPRVLVEATHGDRVTGEKVPCVTVSK